MELFYILGLVLTFVSYAVYWVSRFLRTKKGIIITDLIAKILTIIAMWFLGSWTGVWGQAASIYREFAALYKEKVRKRLLILFISVLLVRTLVLVFVYEGIPSWMAYICWVLNVVPLWWGTPQQIRLYGAVGNIFYTIFQVMIANWVGVVCELVVFLCNVSSFMYYKNKKNKRTRRKGKAHAKSTKSVSKKRKTSK